MSVGAPAIPGISESLAERIASEWGQVWRVVNRDNRWHRRAHLCNLLRLSGVSERTAKAVLKSAERAGILQTRNPGSGGPIHYRRSAMFWQADATRVMYQPLLSGSLPSEVDR